MKKIILIKDDKIGAGDLGTIMMDGILQTMSMCCEKQKDLLPATVILVNRGVLLGTRNKLIENQKAVESLKTLQGLGVEILSCETCLNYFELKDEILVGRVASAIEIVPLLLSQESVSL